MSTPPPPRAPCADQITKLDQRVLFGVLDRLDGTKAIVWDRDVLPLINKTVSYNQLKEHNVVQHFTPLNKAIQAKADHVVYILPPTLRSIEDLVAFHLERLTPREQKTHHLCFVPELSYVHKNKLLSSVKWIADRIINLPIRWFPTDDSKWVSLDRPTLLPNLLINEDFNEHYGCAKAIRQIAAQMPRLPRIVYYGEWASRVAHLYNQFTNDAESEKVIDLDQVQDIVVIDRWADVVTPLMTQQTFSGIVDELFGISCQNKIRFETSYFYDDDTPIPQHHRDKPEFDFYVNDDIYPNIRDVHMRDVTGKIQYHIRELRKDEAVIRNVPSVAELSNAVSSIPRIVKTKDALANYMKIVELIFMEKSSMDTEYWSICEQEILSNKYGENVVPFLENAIAKMLPVARVLRLIALQSQVLNGFKESLMETYRRLIFHSYGYSVTPWFIRLQLSGLIKSAFVQGTRNKKRIIESTYRTVDFEAAKKKFRCETDESLTEKDGLTPAYIGYEPLGIRIIEEGIGSDFATWKSFGPTSPGNVPTVDKSRLLFVIGGVTRAEMGIVQRKFPTFKYAATTSVITGRTMIEAFQYG